VRHDERDASGKTMCITVIADNLRLGAATNAVRIATR
jgi:aspartate-semialdehyde dehydrogenase